MHFGCATCTELIEESDFELLSSMVGIVIHTCLSALVKATLFWYSIYWHVIKE